MELISPRWLACLGYSDRCGLRDPLVGGWYDLDGKKDRAQSQDTCSNPFGASEVGWSTCGHYVKTLSEARPFPELTLALPFSARLQFAAAQPLSTNLNPKDRAPTEVVLPW